MARPAPLAMALLLVLAVPLVATAQMPAGITPLTHHEADSELMQRIGEVVDVGHALQSPAVVFSSVKPGADEDGLCVMVTRLGPGEGESLVSGRLLCLLFDPTHLSPEHVLTVRLLDRGGADAGAPQVALSTLATEGKGPIQLVREPDQAVTQPVMQVRQIPPTFVEQTATVGLLRVGAAVTPRGLQVLLAMSEGDTASGGAFTVPTRTQLAEYGVVWGEDAALP